MAGLSAAVLLRLPFAAGAETVFVFMGLRFLAQVLIILFPAIDLWLPNLIYG